MHHDPRHSLRTLIAMIEARPGAVLQGEPWPIRGEWLAGELERIAKMLEKDGSTTKPRGSV